MNHLKAFMAGMVFPATVMPIGYTIAYLSGFMPIKTLPFQFGPLLIPMVFGIWNMLYFEIHDDLPINRRNNRLWLTGATLGVLLVLFGVAIVRLPYYLFGLSGLVTYLPVVGAALVYGLIWRYVIGYLNDLLGLKDKDRSFLKKLFRRKKA